MREPFKQISGGPFTGLMQAQGFDFGKIGELGSGEDGRLWWFPLWNLWNVEIKVAETTHRGDAGQQFLDVLSVLV